MLDITQLFPLEGKLDTDLVSAPEADRIIAASFADKQPMGSRKHAILLAGMVGSGKTTHGWQRLQQLGDVASYVVVNYDEHGAIEQIPAYASDMEAAKALHADPLQTVDARIAVWKKHQPTSQHLRSRVMQQAVAGGYNIFVDSTLTGRFALSFVDNLMKLGYRISIWSYAAGFEDSLNRVLRRDRPEVPDKIIASRMAAFTRLGEFLLKPAEVTLDISDANGARRLLTAPLNEPVAVDDNLMATWTQRIVNDIPIVASHPVYTKQAPALEMAMHSMKLTLIQAQQGLYDRTRTGR